MYFDISLLFINYVSLDIKNVVECIDECIDCWYIENKLIFLVWILVVLLGIWWDYVWNMMLVFFVYLWVCVVRDRSRNWEW